MLRTCLPLCATKSVALLKSRGADLHSASNQLVVTIAGPPLVPPGHIGTALSQ
jgi:hypothetical protein